MIDFNTLQNILNSLYEDCPLRVSAIHTADSRIVKKIEGMNAGMILDQLYDLSGGTSGYNYTIKIGMG